MQRDQKPRDPQYLKEVLKHIGEENGYSNEEVRDAMQTSNKTQRKEETLREEETSKGVVVMPNIPNFTPQFRRIARRHLIQCSQQNRK